MQGSLLDQDVIVSQPLPRKWKWIRGLFVAVSCIPWLFLVLAWDFSYIETDFNVALMLSWLIIVPISFLLSVLAPVLLRLESRAAGPARFWWSAIVFAAGPLLIGMTLTAINGPSLLGNN